MGRKLFKALQDFGAYLTTDSGWYATHLAVTDGVIDEFQRTYGHPLGGNSGAVYADWEALVKALHVVRNNGPDAIGGGGAPRAPLAPPFAAPDADPPTAPGAIIATNVTASSLHPDVGSGAG